MNLQKLLCDELKRQLSAPTIRAAQIPAGGALLWRWFTDLSRARTYGQAGPNPISHADIVSYGHIMRLPIEPRHVAILRAMDETYLEHAYSKKDETPEGVKKLPPRSAHEITTGAFDAMFGGSRVS
jgi:hypothetical protein